MVDDSQSVKLNKAEVKGGGSTGGGQILNGGKWRLILRLRRYAGLGN